MNAAALVDLPTIDQIVELCADEELTKQALEALLPCLGARLMHMPASAEADRLSAAYHGMLDDIRAGEDSR